MDKKQTSSIPSSSWKLGESLGDEGVDLVLALSEVKWTPVVEIMDSLRFVCPVMISKVNNSYVSCVA